MAEQQLDDQTRYALDILANGSMDGFPVPDDDDADPTVTEAANKAAAAAAAAAEAAEAAAKATNNAIRAIYSYWRPTEVPSGGAMSKAMATFAIQCGLPVYATIETVIYVIATILLDEDLRAQTGMTFQELNFNSVTALSFQLMLGSMRYSGALQPTAVQHSPGEPCVKPLDVFSLPIQWPANTPASLHMRAYSMLGMGYIMLASQQV